MVLTTEQWQALEKKISEEYPRSVSMIRSCKREVLGFTERHHRRWVVKTLEETGCWNGGYYNEEVHLDFFDEAKRTFLY